MLELAYLSVAWLCFAVYRLGYHNGYNKALELWKVKDD